MNLQKAVIPYDWFVRCIGLGPQTRKVNYDPSAPLHDRYTMDIDFLAAEDAQVLEDMTLTINAFFGWDFNSCEALAQGRRLVSDRLRQRLPGQPGDLAALPLPLADQGEPALVDLLRRHRPQDAQEPRLGAVLRRRRPGPRPARAAARATPTIAHERFETEKFRDFCRTHLGHLDELAYEFFGSETMRDAVRQKVTALFPAHEIDEFTELFFGRVQRWREQEGARGDEDGF